MTALRAVVFAALEAAFVLLVLATIVFVTLRVVPGDPAALVLGDEARPEDLAALRHRLHLDEPWSMQYARFLRGMATLDFGDSLRRPGVSSASRIRESLGPTTALATLSVAIGAVTGTLVAVLGVGPWLGPSKRWVDRAVSWTAATPLLAFAPLVTYVLAARLHLVRLPGDPDAGASGLLFAATLLAIPLGAQVARIARAALGEITTSPFLSVARAKGGSAFRVWFGHALPATAGPLVTVVGTQLGALLGGAVVLERLFERPGLGSLILEAYASRDLPLLEGAVVASGALFVATQALAAGVHAWVDPRVRR
ncbi:MAG: ABC transporter permease [Polyangiaceae bacterium]